MDDIAHRLGRLEARTEISELRAKYGWYMTRADVDNVVALFTEDCLFLTARKPDNASQVRGRAALRDYLARARPGRRVPMVMNEVIAIDGDTATGTCVMQSVGEEAFCGHYVDSFRKVGGVWLFSERRFYGYWPDYAPDAVRRDP
jgi:ketosteroid isomerase-like protein